MHNDVITHLDQITRDWLTAALAKSGALNNETRPFWLPMLQKAMVAFDDLGCAHLQP